jgi:hypothetical protein
MRYAAPLVLALGLAACASMPSETGSAPAGNAGANLPSTETDTCGAGKYAELIGASIDGPGIPGPSRLVRHIKPGSQVTMDYIGQRMNIETDESGKIRKINCG